MESNKDSQKKQMKKKLTPIRSFREKRSRLYIIRRCLCTLVSDCISTINTAFNYTGRSRGGHFYPIFESISESDPKNSNQNPNSSNKILERYLVRRDWISEPEQVISEPD
ncbi:BnaA09g12130D [Brassica napus]|uniref:(rape) hypothetical protein n=1 Tax=Brassica napus TaxID=3708 RepID=A0A078IEQ1_BRANA|nr:unnamed protein product [Brassica napus]CDY47834.1 BnaA09g12130D [Brassica napus]